MAHTLTESATHTASITVPDDGDNLEVASVNVAFQALANRTHLANQRLTGNATIPALAVTGPISAGGNVEADGNVTAQNEVYAQEGLATDGDLYVGGQTTLGTDSSDGIICNGNIAFNGLVVNELKFSAQGRTQYRVTVGANSNTSYGPATTSFVYAGTLSAPRVYTISDTDAANGDWIVFNNPTAHVLTIEGPGSVPLLELVNNGTGPGNNRWVWARFMRIAGSWVVIERGF